MILNPFARQDQAPWKNLLLSPSLWVLAVVLLLHTALFIPHLFVQKYEAKLQVNFTEWWENSGKGHFASKGITPTTELFKKEKELYVRQGVEAKYWAIAKLRWWLGLEAKNFSFGAYVLHWLFAPSWLNLLLMIWFFPWALQAPEKRWGPWTMAALGLAAVYVNGLGHLLLGAMQSARTLDYPFYGSEAWLAFALGASLRLSKQDAVFQIWTGPRKPVQSIELPYWAPMTLWWFISALSNWFIMPGSFSRQILLNLVIAGIAYAIALKIPERAKTVAELRAMREKELIAKPIDHIAINRIRAQEHLSAAWTGFNGGDSASGLREMLLGIDALFQNPEQNKSELSNAFSEMLGTKYELPIDSQHWLEWGVRLHKTGLPEHSFGCLERGLASEKSPTLARKALMLAAEQRIQTNHNPRMAIAELRKARDYAPDDPLGKAAQAALTRHAELVTREDLAEQQEKEAAEAKAREQAEREAAKNRAFISDDDSTMFYR